MELNVKERIIYLREYVGEMAICASIGIFLVGLLSLTVLGSSLFTFCSIAGTLLLVSGALAKLGVLHAELKSKTGIQILMTYASALLLTTAMLVLFTDVSADFRVVHSVTIGLCPNPTNAGYDTSRYWATEAPEPFSGVKLDLLRPYAWLAQPLLIVGALLFAIAVALHLFE